MGNIYLLAFRNCKQNLKIQIGSAVRDVYDWLFLLVICANFSISARIEMLITAKIKVSFSFFFSTDRFFK